MAEAMPYKAALVRKKIAGLIPQKGGHMTQAKSIKASVGFRKLSAGDVLARANAILDGVYTAKDDYANPPVDQATLKSQIDALSAGITAALDGGKKAVARRKHLKEVVINSLGQLGHYVGANCKDDMPTFLKSGFQPISTVRTPAAPLSESIRKIAPGKNSGQMEVTLVSQQDALAYQLRWAAVGSGATPGNWTEQPVGNVKSPALVTGLSPGMAYAFQVRAVTNAGYTDWSESVTRICT